MAWVTLSSRNSLLLPLYWVGHVVTLLNFVLLFIKTLTALYATLA